MALILTATVAYTGVQQDRLIRAYEAQQGLRYAGGAVIVGVLLTVVSWVIIVVAFTSGDTLTRPLL